MTEAKTLRERVMEAMWELPHPEEQWNDGWDAIADAAIAICRAEFERALREDYLFWSGDCEWVCECIRNHEVEK